MNMTILSLVVLLIDDLQTSFVNVKLVKETKSTKLYFSYKNLIRFFYWSRKKEVSPF